MKYYSTNHKALPVSAREAVLSGLAPDGGLYVPESIPALEQSFIDNLSDTSLQEIAFCVSTAFLEDDVDKEALEKMAKKAFDFDAPLVDLSETLSVLELFHGPTLAFKDFGARFMARLMSYFQRGENRELSILVATSGDTGSAVANGFFGVEGIRVVVLYPSGQVSDFQEKQLTTLRGNVTAVEVKGSFDDCQRLVKSSFVDNDIKSKLCLTSANSINIARLIPQSFYYFRALAQTKSKPNSFVISVPSGNFGNLTAGLYAKRMGLPVCKFIASTNANDVVVQYLKTGEFSPRASVSTLSNAMDVGNPSNFARMLCLYENSVERMGEDVFGAGFSDEQTKSGIKETFERYGYVLDPHGAVGYLGFKSYLERHPGSAGIVFETAHPSKFGDTVRECIGREPEIPERARGVLKKEKQAEMLSKEFEEFKEFLWGWA